MQVPGSHQKTIEPGSLMADPRQLKIYFQALQMILLRRRITNDWANNFLKVTQLGAKLGPNLVWHWTPMSALNHFSILPDCQKQLSNLISNFSAFNWLVHIIYLLLNYTTNFSLNYDLDVYNEWFSSQTYFILWPTSNDMVAFTYSWIMTED